MTEFEGITTAPGDPRHVQQLLDHIAHLDDEQVATIRDQLNQWAEAAAAPEPARGVWTYSFPDAFDSGRAKSITITRPEELEHREVEELMERYGATQCQCVPPGAAS